MGFRTTVKTWFKTGDKPIQSQFYQLFDWLRWKDEGIDISEVNNLDTILGNKAERSVVNDIQSQVTDVKNTVTYVASDVENLKLIAAKGIKPLDEVALQANTAFELVLPANSMLFALVINGASTVIVGTDAGQDDLGDSAYPFKRVFQVGLPPNGTIWLQSDTAVTINPIILQM